MVAAWLRQRDIRFHHSPNETFTRSFAQKMMNKKKGVSTGFPDLLILMPRGLCFMELKRVKGSKTSDEQLEWQAALRAAGYPCEICKGAEQAIEVLTGWYYE